MTPYNQILTLKADGYNNTQIAKLVGCSRRTVITVLKLVEEKQFLYKQSEGMSDVDIHRILHIPIKQMAKYLPIDTDKVVCMIAVTGCSVSSEWTKYSNQCAKEGKIAYSKSMFQKYVNAATEKQSVTFRNVVNIYVWEICEKDQEKERWILVCEATFSHYMTAVLINGFTPRKWVDAHNELFKRLGGIPENIVYTTRIKKNIRQCTMEMYDFYGVHFADCTHKKYNMELKKRFDDWCSVKHDIGICEKVRQYCEMNNSESWMGGLFNKTDAFQIEKSRYISWTEAYDLVEVKNPVVQCNFHVVLENNFYSVPFEFRHEKITAYLTGNYVELCVGDVTVAVHDRAKGHSIYCTIAEHMPPNDRAIPFGEISGTSLRKWAAKCGQSTYHVIDRLLKRTWCEQQSYLICRLILMLEYKYSPERLDQACSLVLETKGVLSYRAIRNFIESEKRNQRKIHR